MVLLQETKQYREATKEKKLSFEALKKKDENSAREIARQNKKLDKLQVQGMMVLCDEEGVQLSTHQCRQLSEN